LSYPGTHIFVIVFDVASDISFENAVVKWQTDIKSFESNAINVFVANKIDKLSKEELKAIRNKNIKVLNAKGRDNHYFECSALTGDGVEELFNSCIKLEIDRRKKKSRSFCAII
jgi:GTPase SAR1 family protein